MEIKNNNVLQYDKQIKVNQAAYLDANIMPVLHKKNLPLAYTFNGEEIVVLEDEDFDNQTTRYMKKGNEWVIKNTIITGDDVE